MPKINIDMEIDTEDKETLGKLISFLNSFRPRDLKPSDTPPENNSESPKKRGRPPKKPEEKAVEVNEEKPEDDSL